MKRIYLLLALLLFGLSAGAQKFISIREKSFNYGANIGFNAAFPIINSITIDGAEAEDVLLQYEVGFQASLFCRINVERFFIQPSVGWYRTEGHILFTIPNQVKPLSNQVPNTSLSLNELQTRTSAIGLPVFVGYNLVREGPYGLSLMAGPKFYYNHKTRYTSNMVTSPHLYVSDNSPFGMNLVTGLSVSIWRLFLDFTYEFGLNHSESTFKEISVASSQGAGDMKINKRTNVMNFSLGVLF